jgi:acyl-coenzyme A thioesterase PaaI-like protein
VTPEVRAWLEAFPTRGLLETLQIEIVDAEPGAWWRRCRSDARAPAVRAPARRRVGGARRDGGVDRRVAELRPGARDGRGLEINANHLRSVREGTVTAVGTPLHLGRTTQVWEIRISDARDRLVCVSRCTIAVVPLQRPG